MTLFRRIIFLASVAALAVAVPIGIALAADGRLDLADDHIEKAIVLVDNSKNPNAKDLDRPFGGHDEKALKLLEAALRRSPRPRPTPTTPRTGLRGSGMPRRRPVPGHEHDGWYGRVIKVPRLMTRVKPKGGER